MIKDLLKMLILLASLCVMVYGVYLIYIPLAYIFGGAYLFAAVVLNTNKAKAK